MKISILLLKSRTDIIQSFYTYQNHYLIKYLKLGKNDKI